MITCKFENNNQAQLRHVTVGAIVINEKNQILLTKRAPHLLRGNTYTIPGGFLDRDENTKEATLRETLEETGIVGEILSLFRINDNPNRPKEDRQNVDFIYLVKAVGGSFNKNDEVTEVGWFDENAIPKESAFAFDHRESIMRYLEYLKSPFPLPIIG